MIELGSEVKDRITGFRGIAIGRTKWITGCDTITVQPPVDKEGKNRDSQYFDEPRLDVIASPKMSKPPTGTGVG